jgi:peptidoglycan/LPS O-acetylase OafA/YrhL
LRHYLVRRISRVFPFYWVVLLVSLGLLALSTHQRFPTAHDIIYSFLLLPQGKEPVVGVAWTLVFEVLFYTLFAMAIVNKWVGLVLFSSWLVFVVSRSLGLDTGFSGPLLGTLGSAFCIEFFFGMGAAYLLVHRRLPLPRGILAAGIAVFLSSAILELSGVLDGYGVLARFCYGTASMILVLGLVECERQGLLVVPRALSIAGRASYSIYLVHLVVIGLVYKVLSLLALPRLLPLWTTYLLLSALAIVGGIAVSMWVEYPSIRFFRGLLEPRKDRQ